MVDSSKMGTERFWPSLHRDPNVVVFGANGGIGSALTEHLGRAIPNGNLTAFDRKGMVGIEDENLVAEYALRAARSGPLDVVIMATGVLHDHRGLLPEKRFADLSAANLARSFAVNAIGPALVAKHFLPLLRRNGKTVFVALSARVGSISDNQLGGWASYRASKAALNMLLRTAAIEQRRTNPNAIVAALHPGTVDTPLSAPFQANLKPGQLFTAEVAAQHLADVIEALTPADSGGFFAWDGTPIEY